MRGFDPPPKHPELITAQLGERIRALLEDLVSRVKVGVPGALGAVRNDGLDPNGAHREYATFLASHDGDAITVTILLRHLGPGVVCTAESVREATVIDEMPELRVVGLDPTATAGAILRAVTAFVRSQEDRVVTELKREA